MADASVEFLLNKIDTVLTRELTLPDKINAGVRNLKRELEMMKEFLKEADCGEEQEISVWVGHVQDLAHDIEDALDMIELDEAEKRVTKINSVKFWRNHSMANSIDEIEKSLQEIKSTRERYPVIRKASGGKSSMLADHISSRIAFLSLKEADLVAIKDDKSLMSSWARDKKDSYKVLFVVGMGGSGKSTLVKQVFDGVKKDFDCHAWITVSKSGKLDIFLELLDQLCNSSAAESTSQQKPSSATEVLIIKLQNFLQSRRYLLVLDDLWLNDVWESIENALPKCNNSRVIITTRRGDIACSRRENSISVHKVQPLPLGEAKQLFHRKAFPANNGCPPGLGGWSDVILRKCEGLPLAITQIGQILSARDESVREWKTMHDSLVSQLRRDGRLSNIARVLMLSYHDLPDHLKYCFLFMNVFPHDSPISSRQFIRLWMAKGFIKEQIGKELEDVGEEYLKELIERNLVQVTELDFDGRRPKTCRVHNIMHHIILSKLQDERFCVVHSEEQKGRIEEKTRGISIQAKEFKMPSSVLKARTLLMFSPRSAPPGLRPDVNYSSFKLLKQLHLQGFDLDKFPKEIEELLLLRYLCLRSTSIKHVPGSIRKLQYLETLDLKQSKVTKLPKEIGNLVKLRHLLVYRYDMGLYVALDTVKGFEVSETITTLTNLQTLSFVKAHSRRQLIRRVMGLNDNIQMLGRLKSLRKLGIIDLTKKDGKSLCETIQRLSKLYSLNLTSMHIDEILDIQEISHPPDQLERLYLKGKLERMPSWISKLNDLARLRLKWSRILPTSSNPIEIIQDLPNLLELQLLDAYTGNQLEFNAGKFQKLKLLDFERLEQLELVITEDSALPCLQKLIIEHCRSLRRVPLGIQHLRCLKELHLYDMQVDFVMQIQKDEQTRRLVRHIPIIHAYHSQQNGEWSLEVLHDFLNTTS